MRDFYQRSYQTLVGLEESCDYGERDFSLACHAFEGDATNSSVWGKTHKLHSLKIRSAFVLMMISLHSSWPEVVDATEMHEVMSDLQVVRSGTGLGALGLMDKHAKSVGNTSHGRCIQVDALSDDVVCMYDALEDKAVGNVCAAGAVDDVQHGSQDDQVNSSRVHLRCACLAIDSGTGCNSLAIDSETGGS